MGDRHPFMTLTFSRLYRFEISVEQVFSYGLYKKYTHRQK